MELQNLFVPFSRRWENGALVMGVISPSSQEKYVM